MRKQPRAATLGRMGASLLQDSWDPGFKTDSERPLSWGEPDHARGMRDEVSALTDEHAKTSVVGQSVQADRAMAPG